MEKNVVVLGIEEYNELLLRSIRLEQKFKDTFELDRSWSEQPRLRVNLEIHRELIQEILDQSDFASTHKVVDELKSWRGVIDVYEKLPEQEESDNLGGDYNG